MSRKNTDGLARELSEKVRLEVERVDMLTFFLATLARPVPEYEPEFRHLSSRLSAYEISGDAN